MELQNQKKLVQHIFRLLKTNEIVIPIGRTNKGNLGIKFQAGSDDFEIYLDAVPLPTKDMLADDNNIELKKMLVKYLWETVKGGRLDLNKMVSPFLEVEEQKVRLMKQVEESGIAEDSILKEILPLPIKKGRPKGSKNKVK